MRVCLGGTFEPFHAGHEALLTEAARGATEIFVGITDGPLSNRPDRPVSPWPARAARVQDFLRGSGFKGALRVQPLADAEGPASSGDYDRIVVSPETERGAQAINATRRKRGLTPLEIRVVAHVLGQDLLPISATAIWAGLIDPDGNRLAPIHVAVGSANGIKVAAVLEEFGRIMPIATDVRGFQVASLVPEQPKDGETLQGARNRAKAALASWPGADYGIGVEAGLLRYPDYEGYLEAQACVVIDRNGWETHGWGPAFHYPAFVTKRALSGTMVSDVLGPIAADPSIGSTTGAIGYLTEGRLDRTALSRIAVLMAFVPRFRRNLYVQNTTNEVSP